MDFTAKFRELAGSAILLLVVGLSISVAFSENEKGHLEGREDLGFGFHRDIIAEPSPGSFESISHFQYLFYRNRKLCRVHQWAVSPNGEQIVYQEDDPAGNIFVFRSSDGRIVRLTQRFVGFVDEFQWYEGEGYILGVMADNMASRTDRRARIRWAIPPPI